MNSSPYVRPPLTIVKPARGADGFYRSVGTSPSLGGVPLDSAEAAVVAAVQLAYKVASTQVDRSTRLARRLREAGDRAQGGDSARASVDATERLIFKSMVSGLTWIETLAADPSPLRRLASAELALLANLLGLRDGDASKARGEAPAGNTEARAPREADPPRRARTIQALKVRLRGDPAVQRAVRVVRWETDGALPLRRFTIYLHHTHARDEAALEAAVVVPDRDAAVLEVDTGGPQSSGVWRGAVCDDDGLQLGLIDIEI